MDNFKKKYDRILEYVGGDDMFINEAQNQNTPDDGMDDGMDPNMPANGMGGGMDPNMSADGMGGGMDPNMPADGMGGNGMGGNGQAPEGFNPEMGDTSNQGGVPGMDGSDMPNDDFGGDLETEQPGDEVIDVDDLTTSQENTEKKIDLMSDRFEKLFKKLDSFEERLDASNDRIDSIRAEIEKRNPTPVEKLTLRSKNAYPFNISTDEYWNEKEKTSNYSTEDDKNGADDVKFKITKSQIDDISDWENISKSMDTNKVGLLDILDF